MKISKFKILVYFLPVLIFFALTAYCTMQYIHKTKLQKQLNNIETADKKIQKTLETNKYGYSDVILAVENSKKMQFINFKMEDRNNKGSITAIIEYNGDVSSLNESLEDLLAKNNFKDFKAINIINDSGNIKANIDAEFILNK